MGGDGGSIPTRTELVRVKKAPEKISQVARLVARWQQCALTETDLVAPVMACELGRMFNKEAAINYLLTKDSTSPEQRAIIGHVRGLKDMRELRLTANDSYDGKADSARYVCPVTGLAMNGRHGFVFFWSCCCVLSERAVREVKSDACHKCGKAYTAADIIMLCPGLEEEARLQEAMKVRRKSHKLAKDKASGANPAKQPAVDKSDLPAASKRRADDSVSVSSTKAMRINPALGLSISGLVEDEMKKSVVYQSLFMEKGKAEEKKRGLAGFGQTFF